MSRDIEGRLRDAVAAKMATVDAERLRPSSPPNAPDRVDPRNNVRRRPRWIAPLTAAAAVAIIAIGTTTAVTLANRRPTLGTPSPTPSATVAPTPTASKTAAAFPEPTVSFTYTGPSETTCGSWYVSAVTPSGSIPLAGCNGLVGGGPTITIKVGDEVLIRREPGPDAPGLTLTPDPSTRVTQSGSLFLATAPGLTVIMVSGSALCAPPTLTQPASRTCALVTIKAL